jgi:hypothetical protein
MLEESNWRRPDLGRRYPPIPYGEYEAVKTAHSKMLWVSAVSGAITALIVMGIAQLV